MSPAVLLTDLPAFCTAHGVAWAEIKDAMRIGTITGFKATDGIFNCDPKNVVELKNDYGVPRD